MKFTGQKTLAMFTRYNTVDGNNARLAIELLGGFLKEKSAPIVAPKESR